MNAPPKGAFGCFRRFAGYPNRPLAWASMV